MSGKTVKFTYTNLAGTKSEERFVRVEEVKISRENQEILTGWDYDAYGFRSFRMSNVHNMVEV